MLPQMFNIIHISKANFYPNYPYVTPHCWEICIIFRTWKHQHSQICKFATVERSLSEKNPGKFQATGFNFRFKATISRDTANNVE